MKKLIAVISGFLLTANCLGYAQVTSFNTCKLADVKGKRAKATLIFNDESKNIQIRASDRALVTIPYENIDKFTYGFTMMHRVNNRDVCVSLLMGPPNLPKHRHWLYIDYREQNVSKTVVLRLDKKDYKQVLDAVKTHTRREVPQFFPPMALDCVY